MFGVGFPVCYCTRPNLIKPVSTKNVLSTEKYCLTETGYQLKLLYIVVTGGPLNFCLAKTFFKQFWGLKELYEGILMYMSHIFWEIFNSQNGRQLGGICHV